MLELDWLVFRGISDFGNRKKKDRQQALAATSAATLLVQFLKSVFRVPRAVEEIEF